MGMDTENKDRPGSTRGGALQRHHDYYTKLVVTGFPSPDDLRQAELAMKRRLNGEVNHLVDSNGIKLVIDP